MRPDSKHEHLAELLRSFDTAFLVTHGVEGPHARPLLVAAVEGPTVVWFVTSAASAKVDEIARDENVMVTFQGKRRFVALRGIARLVKDRKKIAALWSEAQRIWFPEGPSDPKLVLVRVRVDYAELWDQSGIRGVKFALAAAQGYLKGTVPEEPQGRHAVLRPGIARP